METLILQISSFIFYLNFCKSFFGNTLSSKLFRKVFKERMIMLYQRMTCWKVRGQSIGTTRMDESKMGTATLQ